MLTGEHQIGFALGAYDRAHGLVIDPVLAYSSYLGGNGLDVGNDIAVDSTGAAYVIGQTASTNFPTANPLQAAMAGPGDAFVTKLNPAGSALVYSTYLGGSSIDEGSGIAVDSTGAAYVTGQTFSTNFPTTNPVQAAAGGGGDAFATKLNPAGSALVYSTYLGGSALDRGTAIAVDPAGAAIVTGQTSSTNFPTANAVQAALAGSSDGFVTKLDPAGSALAYSTYLGGTSDDSSGSSDIAVDAAGAAYVAGDTTSSDFPTVNAYQAALAGSIDAFVTKLDPGGSALVYSTYLGGNAVDLGSGVAVDATGAAYVTGQTTSPNLPTVNALQPTYAGGVDAFVTKLNAAGTALVYSTYLGGTAVDLGSDIAVGPTGSAGVTGFTRSDDFPTASPVQAVYAGNADAFVAQLASSGSALIEATYLGGTADEAGYGIAVDAAGAAYVAGYTGSTDFPTANPLQAAYAGGYDAFVAKIDPTTSSTTTTTSSTTTTTSTTIPPTTTTSTTIPGTTCLGRTATIVGTPRNDRLVGTPGPDVIIGLDGNDSIQGLGGNDVICGGTRNDVLDGGEGADVIDGEAGADRVIGGQGPDDVRGGGGSDSVFGGKGNDRLAGDAGVDSCDGGTGTNVFATCEIYP